MVAVADTASHSTHSRLGLVFVRNGSCRSLQISDEFRSAPFSQPVKGCAVTNHLDWQQCEANYIHNSPRLVGLHSVSLFLKLSFVFDCPMDFRVFFSYYPLGVSRTIAQTLKG